MTLAAISTLWFVGIASSSASDTGFVNGLAYRFKGINLGFVSKIGTRSRSFCKINPQKKCQGLKFCSFRFCG